MQRSAGKCKSHARHHLGLQLSSDSPAGLPGSGSVTLGLSWPEKDLSYGIRQAAQLTKHKDLCRSPQQTSIPSTLLPGWLSCPCHLGQSLTQEEGGRDPPKRGERLNFSLQ